MLEGVEPDSGLASGGTKVTILGSDFVPGSKILFGDSEAAMVGVVNDKMIDAVTPAHSVGRVDVKIVTPDQLSAVMSKAFRFGQVLFADGFESGNFSAWDSAGMYSCSTYGSSYAVDSFKVHSGTKSADFHYVIPSDKCASAQDTDVVVLRSFNAGNGYPNGLRHVFIRGYVYFKTPEPGGTEEIQRKLYYIADKTDWSMFLTSDGVLGELRLRFSTNNTPYLPSVTYWDLATLSYDQWYCVELEVALNTPGLRDGKLALWVDGEQTFEVHDIDLRGPYTTDAQRFLIGMQSNRTNFLPVDEYRFWDDIVIADAYIGP